MIRMTVADMAAATLSTIVYGSGAVVFEGVTVDSRLVREGIAFVGFVGERVDGNQYAAAAIEAGAKVAVVTTEPGQDVLEAAERKGAAVVRSHADDGERFMLSLARAWRKANPQWTVVGVTGSVGKTTTKEMLAAGIGASRRTHATKGNFNNLLGVPLTLFDASPDDEVLVVEMGMNHAGELERLSSAAMPDVAVITNVGTSHIGNLGSREGIARAKAEIITGMRPGGEPVPSGRPTLVLTDSDDFADFIEQSYCERNGIATFRVGGDQRGVWASDVVLDDQGRPELTLLFEDGLELRGKLSLPGRAMVFDALSAMGVVHVLGLPRKEAFDALCAMAPAHMRLEVRKTEGSAHVIDDSYNASPASMASAIEVLCSIQCEGRRVAVLGEMGELGREAERLHAMVGAYAAAKPIDLLVFVGDEGARIMEDGARTMGYSEDNVERFATADEAAQVMAPVFGENDLVLVKGSRAVGLDHFVREVLGT